MFTITRNDISPKLRQMIKAVKPPERKRVLRAMGTTFKSLAEGSFNSAGAQYRPQPWPAKKDGSQSILQSPNPTLSKSFSLEVTDDTAKVGNPTKYAARHQFGDEYPGIPPRPFFPVSNGKLTPQAEEKIARAARRVLDAI
jgi:phage gpG-like protein